MGERRRRGSNKSKSLLAGDTFIDLKQRKLEIALSIISVLLIPIWVALYSYFIEHKSISIVLDNSLVR